MTSLKLILSARIPGDEILLELAAEERRIFITIDKDFGELIFLHQSSHCGLIRLPDLAMAERIALVEQLIRDYQSDLELGSVITVQSGRVRTSHPADYVRNSEDEHQ